jgi:hypothetical protein
MHRVTRFGVGDPSMDGKVQDRGQSSPAFNSRITLSHIALPRLSM